MTETSDISRLISNCLYGDETAIEQLINIHRDRVFRLALSVLEDSAEANDVTQDTFIAALAALESYQDQSSFKAWLYTITLNISRSRLRKRKALERLRSTLRLTFQVQAQGLPSPEDSVIGNEKNAELWCALRKLSEKHRLPVILRYGHGLSSVEIAAILNISEGTVHSRLHFAREKLRKELEKQSASAGE